MKNNSVILILALATLVACNNPAPPTTSFDIEKVKAAINEVNQKFSQAVSQNDSVGWAGLYHSEAILMAPNGDSMTGTDNLLAFFSAIKRLGVKTIKLTSTEVIGQPEAVVETGEYVLEGDDGAMLDRGKYIVVWREENNQWKLFRDIWNTSMPPVGQN
jgi:ketosteroid isomerase-like protein